MIWSDLVVYTSTDTISIIVMNIIIIVCVINLSGYNLKTKLIFIMYGNISLIVSSFIVPVYIAICNTIIYYIYKYIGI